MRILHFADVHLDRPFVSLALDAARRRRHELRAGLERCLTVAREHDANLVTIGGDLWEDEHVTPDTRRFVAAQLERFGLPVVMICGNHDPFLAGGNYARTEWPDNVHLCTSGTPVEFEFGPVSVWAVSWLGGYLELGWLDTFSVPADGRVHLLLLHGTASDLPGAMQPESAAAPFSSAAAERSGFALCLAGHIHAAVQVRRVLYPGSPEPLGWSEGSRHTVALVDTEHAGSATLLDVNRRRYVSRQVDCEDALSSAIVQQRLASALTDDTPASVYLRLDLIGQIASDCDIDVEALEEAAGGQYAGLVIRNRTVPEYDLESFGRQNTATGHFVRTLSALIQQATEASERERLELALRVGLHALHGRRELIRVD